MNMRIKFGLFSLAILLSACSTTTTNYYHSSVESWRGANVNALVAQWGRPDYKVAAPGGGIMLAYRTQSYSTYAPPTSPAIGVNNTGGRPVITVAPNTNNTWNRGPLSIACNVLFKANAKGVITETQVQGTNCYGGQSFATKYANPAMNGR
jgi:hypothetical protein